MSPMCESIEALSTEGHWDNVFHCLKVDVNSFIELERFSVSENHNTQWISYSKALETFLQFMLDVLLVCNYILCGLLLMYLPLKIAKVVSDYNGIIYEKAKHYIGQKAWKIYKKSLKSYLCGVFKRKSNTK
ncbi:uncharacterized protein LOC131995123 [Stomoxys calcitrans]|uniref:uncharacterized protein LOC131995123 n=1 Tax=Stomoxys calcitrans TaxID=35570 RepID=UPI0027E35178|nr:uncharacterized protein LOC131995123 [Stomoxys calcitrans]